MSVTPVENKPNILTFAIPAFARITFLGTFISVERFVSEDRDVTFDCFGIGM